MQCFIILVYEWLFKCPTHSSAGAAHSFFAIDLIPAIAQTSRLHSRSEVYTNTYTSIEVILVLNYNLVNK